MDVLILGSGYAGVACAARLARKVRRDGSSPRITLVGPRPWLVERIRLHQAAAGQRLAVRRIDTLLAGAGVAWHEGWAEAIDLQARRVHLTSGETLGWDRLMLALGSASGGNAVPGGAEHALCLDGSTVAALHSRLRALRAGDVVSVVGTGLTGIEAAAELAAAFPELAVQLVGRGELAAGFGAPARVYLREALHRLGVGLHEDRAVLAVGAGELKTTGGPLPHALCLWTAGFEMPDLPRRAGLAVNDIGQIQVDPMLRSVSHPAVYAAGDIAAPVRDPGQPLPMGCKVALPAGAQVGDNLADEAAGRPAQAFDWARMFFCISLGRRDGLIQWAEPDGRLEGRILTGRRGAAFKELVCRSTWWSLVAEARGLPGIWWPRTGRAPGWLAGADQAEQRA